jgi:salicylate hydroxylase
LTVAIVGAGIGAAFDGWDPRVHRILGAMDHTFRWGIYDREPMKTWSTDRITLLGDAAHAVTPHLGQGANQSVEDAITRAVLLRDAGPNDIPARLRRYEDLRIDRNRQVREGARAAAMLYRTSELSPARQAAQIVEIYDSPPLNTHDPERIANAALATL